MYSMVPTNELVRCTVLTELARCVSVSMPYRHAMSLRPCPPHLSKRRRAPGKNER